MTDQDFYTLTFSQREGKVPLPEPMKLEYLPDRFRQLVWKYIDDEFFQYYQDDEYRFHNYIDGYDGHISNILYSYRFDILSEPHSSIHDPMDSNYSENDRDLVQTTLLDKEYHVVLAFIEYVLRDSRCPEKLHNLLQSAFNETPIAYFVDEKCGLLTIMPRASREAGDAVRQNIESLHRGSMDGASAHLRQSVEHINAQQYADSIADSIHAIESVARVIEPKAGDKLSSILNLLEKKGILKHKALKEALKKLYGYTSNEQGIRHALLNKNAPDVGLDEAIFMFGACASFAAYLANKHRQLGQESDGQ